MIENARIVLEVSCRARAGESLLILADDAMRTRVPALCAAARGIGVVPVVLDVQEFLSAPAYARGYIHPALKAAIEAADIVLQNLPDTWVTNRPDYGRLTGRPDLQDAALTGERRWCILQCRGMEQWKLTREGVAAIRHRTLDLLCRLGSAFRGRITSEAGTDLEFGLGAGATRTPILGIIPLYGEVAVVPELTATCGVLVVDGPTQLDVRPATEQDRPPLRIEIEAGRVRNLAGGDPAQLERLRRFIASGSPAADAVDEVGIVTTSLVENDLFYWSDGTHHHDCVHVALGNSVRRDAIVHGPRHMDCEVHRPTLRVDGHTVVQNGRFLDGDDGDADS